MKNRFVKQRRGFGVVREVLLPILLFVVIGALFIIGINSIGRTTEEERLRSVEKAVTKATVQCYAVEGRYPPSLNYLEENYGLALDYDRYIIQYDAFATNIMPTILVMPRDFQSNSTGGFQDENGF